MPAEPTALAAPRHCQPHSGWVRTDNQVLSWDWWGCAVKLGCHRTPILEKSLGTDYWNHTPLYFKNPKLRVSELDLSMVLASPSSELQRVL